MCYMVATSGPPGALAALALPGNSAATYGGTRGGGAAAASSAYYLLNPATSSSLGGGGYVSAAAARAAAAALDSPLLCGEARMPEDAAAAEGGASGCWGWSGAGRRLRGHARQGLQQTG